LASVFSLGLITTQLFGNAFSEIQAFFKKSGKVIIPFTVKEILDEQIAYKLA
jgi:hypothetical protein